MKEVLTKQELSEILGVKVNSIRGIESQGRLEQKLKEKGYKLISKEKSGRSFNYTVECFSKDKESVNNCMQTIFNITNNEESQSDYIMYRLLNMDKPISKKYLSELCNVSDKTISRWDKRMCNMDLFARDGYFYISMDFVDDDTANYRITDEYEYKTFIKNNLILKKRIQAYDDLINNKIDRILYEMINDSACDSFKANYGKIVYKVSKYKIGQSKELLKIVVKSITNYYKDKTYYLDWLESIPKEKRADYYINED